MILRGVLLIFIGICMSTIEILEPQPLAEKYIQDPLQYVTLNVGDIAYGKSIMGEVIMADPNDGCSPLKNQLTDEQKAATVIVFVKRDQCKFSEKVINAQNFGASLILIGDTINEEISSLFPVERSKAILDLIKIPGILLAKSDMLNFNEILSKKKQRVEISVNFNLAQIKTKHSLVINA